MLHKKLKHLPVILLLVFLAAIFLFPVVFTILASFMEEKQIATVFGTNISWKRMLPDKLTLSSYNQLLFDYFPFYRMFWNSILYSTTITFFGLIINFLAAFAFYHSKFKGKNILYVIYILLMMMPLQVTILPNYIGLREMNLYNTHYAIILPLVFSPFGVVVLRQFMSGLDNGMIEAMRLETNSILRILMTAVAPQVKVCISAVILFVFVDSWSMVEQPLLLVKDDRLKALSNLFSNSSDLGMGISLAASVIFIVPVLILYINFNEQLEKGLTLGTFSIRR